MDECKDNGISKLKDNIHCLNIIGQIEGHIVLPSQTKTTKYEHVLPLLAGIEESDDIEEELMLYEEDSDDEDDSFDDDDSEIQYKRK